MQKALEPSIFSLSLSLVEQQQMYISPSALSKRRMERAKFVSLEFAGVTLVTCLFLIVYYLVLGVRMIVRAAMDIRAEKEDGDPNGLGKRARTVINALDSTSAGFRANMVPFIVLLWINAATASETNACVAGILFVALTMVRIFMRIAASEWRALPLLLPTTRSQMSTSIDRAWSLDHQKWSPPPSKGARGGSSPCVTIAAVLQSVILAYLLLNTALHAVM